MNLTKIGLQKRKSRGASPSRDLQNPRPPRVFCKVHNTLSRRPVDRHRIKETDHGRGVTPCINRLALLSSPPRKTMSPASSHTSRVRGVARVGKV